MVTTAILPNYPDKVYYFCYPMIKWNIGVWTVLFQSFAEISFLNCSSAFVLYN